MLPINFIVHFTNDSFIHVHNALMWFIILAQRLAINIVVISDSLVCERHRSSCVTLLRVQNVQMLTLIVLNVVQWLARLPRVRPHRSAHQR